MDQRPGRTPSPMRPQPLTREHNVARLPGNAFEVRTQPFRQAPTLVNRVQGTPRGIALTTLVYASTPPAEQWFEAVDEAIEDCDAKRRQ